MVDRQTLEIHAGAPGGHAPDALSTLDVPMRDDGIEELQRLLDALSSIGFVCLVRWYLNPFPIDGGNMRRKQISEAMANMPGGFSSPSVTDDGGLYLVTAVVDGPARASHLDSLVDSRFSGIVASSSPIDLDDLGEALRKAPTGIGSQELSGVLTPRPSWLVVRQTHGTAPALTVVGHTGALNDLTRALAQGDEGSTPGSSSASG